MRLNSARCRYALDGFAAGDDHQQCSGRRERCENEMAIELQSSVGEVMGEVVVSSVDEEASETQSLSVA